MFNESQCRIKANIPFRRNNFGARFIRLYNDQQRFENKLAYQEMMHSAQNPIFRAERDLAEVCKRIRDVEKSQFIESKRVQRIRNNTEELRALKMNFHFAECLKSVTEEKERLASADASRYVERIQSMQDLEDQLLQQKEDLQELKIMKKIKTLDYKSFLINQIEVHNVNRKILTDKKFEDRRKMVELNKVIRAEEIIEIKKDKLRKSERNKEILQDIKDKHNRNLSLLKKDVLDREAYDAYLEDHAIRREKFKAQKWAVVEKRLNLSEKLGNALLKLKEAKEQETEVLQELLLAERIVEDENYIDGRGQRKLDEKLKIRAGIDDSYIKTKMINDHRNSILKKQETENHKAFIATLYKKDEGKKEAERRKREFHIWIMDKMCEVRAKERIEEKLAYEQRNKFLNDCDAKKRKEILTERHRMISSQPTSLLCYLPTHALSHKTDEEFIKVIQEEKQKLGKN